MSGLPRPRRWRWLSQFEELLIAVLMGAMTLITFANVVVRYGFNSNILWGLEATVFLFAWLVLLGAAYAVKVNAHLGVDILIAALPAGSRRILGLVATAASLLFAVLMAVGAWQYWLPFAGSRAWYEVNDIYMPEFLQILKDVMNEGERWEKLPRFIPYFALPLGMTMLCLRLVEAGWRIFNGQQDRIIVGHETEDETEIAAGEPRNEGG
ncbi:MAG: TRAP transporter small permease [Alphaproteobacteria bacterium]